LIINNINSANNLEELNVAYQEYAKQAQDHYTKLSDEKGIAELKRNELKFYRDLLHVSCLALSLFVIWFEKKMPK
jgi:hypothetical protein